MDSQDSYSRNRFVTGALVRLLAAIALLAVAGVHIQLYIVEDYRVIPTIGPLFLLTFIGGMVLGLYFLIPASRPAGRIRVLADALAALGGWFLAAGALVGLLVSEHTPLFGFMEHGYRLAIVIALGAEVVAAACLAVFLVYALGRLRALRGAGPARRQADTAGGVDPVEV
jgi:hypothetical protein